jgi:glycosyltransferase involved in cell wall biosynthesis
MRILISAFSCSPNLGSEPGLGWGVVREAALRHEVCVLTDPHNRPHVEEEMAARPVPGAAFVFVTLPLEYHRVADVCWLGYLYYFFWQLRAYRVARRLHKQRAFDLVHHVTYGNSWAPSFMGWLGIPFVWCAGGKEVTPWRFYRVLSWRSRVTETARSLAVKGLGAVTHYCTAAHASVILSSSDTRSWNTDLPVRRFLLGGLAPAEAAALQNLPARTGGPFRVASIGRLQGWKGFALGVMAFAALLRELPESEYWIVGTGPERKWLEKLAGRLGCAGRVRFLDWMPRASLLTLLSEVDVLVHPSLHENFGYVVLEAMAAGRPVVCLGTGGCGELVSDGGGVVIPVSTPGQVASELCGALRQLALDPARRHQEGQQVRKWALEQWNWERAGERLAAVYQDSRKPSDAELTQPTLEAAS